MPKQTLSASVIKIRLIITWKKSNRWALHMRLSTFVRSQGKFYIKVNMLRKWKNGKEPKPVILTIWDTLSKKGTNWGWRYTPHWMYSVPDTTILTVEWYIADIRNGLRWCTLPIKESFQSPKRSINMVPWSILWTKNIVPISWMFWKKSWPNIPTWTVWCSTGYVTME